MKAWMKGKESGRKWMNGSRKEEGSKDMKIKGKTASYNKCWKEHL